jgi:pyruvate/2-oxoglutarate/acetoin dehydrogenase E1 component
LLSAAIRCDDPVVFLEHSRLYRAFREPVPDAPYVLPLDKARVVRAGREVTVLAWGAMVHVAQQAIDEMGVDAELIDLRVLAPLDVPTILESVRRTGRCVIVHEARRTLGLGAELSALVNEHVFDCLKAPVRRVTAFDVHFPENQTEDFYLPDARRVRYGIESVLQYKF